MHATAKYEGCNRAFDFLYGAPFGHGVRVNPFLGKFKSNKKKVIFFTSNVKN